MREADEGMSKHIRNRRWTPMNADKSKVKIGVYLRASAVSLVLVLPAMAIDGTVVNQTTGKPQGGATVTLYKLGQAGMESIESVKSGADGKFSIQQDLQG